MKVWVDGSGRGFYAYITENGQRNIGWLSKTRGRSIKAEFRAVALALRELHTRPLRILTDNSTVSYYCNYWGRVREPIATELETIRPYLLDERVQVQLIDGKKNKADRLIRKHPARSGIVNLKGIEPKPLSPTL